MALTNRQRGSCVDDTAVCPECTTGMTCAKHIEVLPIQNPLGFKFHVVFARQKVRGPPPCAAGATACRWIAVAGACPP